MTTRKLEAGVYYYGARYYDPKVSVWLSVDPLAHEFSSWTPYHFVHNNPLNLIDPTGMAAINPGEEDGDPTKPPNTQEDFKQVPENPKPNIPLPIDDGERFLGPGSGSNNDETSDCSNCPDYFGGSGMLEWASTGGLNVVKAAKSIQAAYRAYKAAKTLKGVTSLLKPAGNMIGKQKARRPDIRTVSPENAKKLIEGLENLGAREVARKGYKGIWYQLPNGVGGFGVRHGVSRASKAKGSSSAIDFDIPGLDGISNIKF